MTISAFDTHKFVRRLENAGIPLEQAELQAEIFQEAFAMNLESLVTKDFLESRLDVRFAKMNAKVDANHRVFLWTQAIIMAAVVIPLLQNLLVT